MLYDSIDIGQNIKPRDGENAYTFAEGQVRELLTDVHPEAFEIKTDAEGADNTTRAIRDMKELQPGEWEKLDLKERAQWIVKVHQHVAEQYGFKPYNVKAQALPANYGGYFSAATRSIVLNELILKDATPNRALNAITHESRHGYQWHAVQNPGSVPADVREKVDIWRNNFANYKNPAIHGYKAYFNQPVEVDARAFAEGVVKGALREPAHA